MTIDINAIQNEFIRIAETEVGDLLHSPQSVFKARDNYPTSNFPYIVFDILSIDDTDTQLLYEGVNESDDICYVTNVRLLLQYTVKGTNALYIANKLRSLFRTNRIRDEITTNTTGKIEDFFSIVSTPERLSTVYLEAAAFNITFNINDTTIDDNENAGIITRINLDGELSRDETQETDPLDLDITESSPDHI